LGDPNVQKTIGQNPQANQITAAMQAHIAEHLGFQYRTQIEQQMGVAMPLPGEKLPQEVEVQLSRLIAQAAVKLKQLNEQKAAQAKVQQQAQDPLLQLQQKELELKQQALQAKTQKDQADIQAKMAQIQVERDRIQSQSQTEEMRIAAQMHRDQSNNQSNMETERLRLGVQTAIKEAEMRTKE
jgi:hypothetical protein